MLGILVQDAVPAVILVVFLCSGVPRLLECGIGELSKAKIPGRLTINVAEFDQIISKILR